MHTTLQTGQLAKMLLGLKLPLEVLESTAGFYIGTRDDCGPCSRESLEYFPTRAKADEALATSDWTQRQEP